MTTPGKESARLLAPTALFKGPHRPGPSGRFQVTTFCYDRGRSRRTTRACGHNSFENEPKKQRQSNPLRVISELNSPTVKRFRFQMESCFREIISKCLATNNMAKNPRQSRLSAMLPLHSSDKLRLQREFNALSFNHRRVNTSFEP